MLDLRGEPEESHFFGAAKLNPFPHLADVTADLAARDAFMVALEAVGVAGHTNTFIPQAGKPIDPSSKGPLAPLEPEESEP
jgi:hypothetical protein